MEDAEVRSAQNLYERDLYTWSHEQADLIKSGLIDRADLANIAEEIEALGRSQAAALESAYRLVCLHQLKRMFQPERADSCSWRLTIGRERLHASRVLRQNPGLKPKRVELFESAYADARAEAALETGLAPATFPRTSPFSLDEIMDHDFWAEPPAS